jgi:hypothetical protein
MGHFMQEDRRKQPVGGGTLLIRAKEGPSFQKQCVKHFKDYKILLTFDPVTLLQEIYL